MVSSVIIVLLMLTIKKENEKINSVNKIYGEFNNTVHNLNLEYSLLKSEFPFTFHYVNMP